MYKKLGISDEVVELVNYCEEDCLEEFKKIDETSMNNSLKSIK